MSEYTASFNIHSKALSERALAQDRDDYHFAISGVDVGRQRRHVQDGDIDPATGEKKKDKVAEAMMRTLEDWLRDENYRKAHETLTDTLRSGLNEADSLLSQIRNQISEAKDALNDMLDKAPRLPDGRRVFRFADGSVKDEEGNIIDDDFAAHIHWPDNAPTGEGYFGLRIRIEDLRTREREVLGIETDLSDIHNRANDNDNPLTPDELEIETDRADGLRDRLDEIGKTIQPREAILANGVEFDVTSSETKVIPVIKIGG